MLETEIWPTLYRGLARRRMPLVLASARLSTKSVDRYRHACVAGRATRSRRRGDRRAERVRRRALPRDRRAAGSRAGDRQPKVRPADPGGGHRRRTRVRAVAMGARPAGVDRRQHARGRGGGRARRRTRRVRARHPDALLVLVPRHPQRFEAVRATAALGGRAISRSAASAAYPGRGRGVPASTRSASCRCSTRRPTSRSWAAAWCRSAATTCSSPPCSACRCSPARYTHNAQDDRGPCCGQAAALQHRPRREGTGSSACGELRRPAARRCRRRARSRSGRAEPSSCRERGCALEPLLGRDGVVPVPSRSLVGRPGGSGSVVGVVRKVLIDSRSPGMQDAGRRLQFAPG